MPFDRSTLGKPRAKFPQNQGMANALAGMQELNNALAARGPVAPYRPTPGPSGLQSYGGAYGQPVANVPGLGNYNADVSRAQGIARQGNGREALLAGMNGMRTGAVAPPQIPTGPLPANPFDNAAYAAKSGMYFNPATGTTAPEGSPGGASMMNATPSQIRGWQASGQGPNYKPPANLGAIQEAYNQRTQQNAQARATGVHERAIARTDARNRRTGNLTNFEAMQLGMPGFAIQNLQNQNSGNWANTQLAQSQMNNQLGWGKLGMENQQQQFGNQAAILGQLPAMVESGAITPQQAQAITGNFIGKFGGLPGGQLPQGGVAGRRTLPPAKFAEFANLPPAQMQQWLIANGITDLASQQDYIRKATGGGTPFTTPKNPSGTKPMWKKIYDMFGAARGELPWDEIIDPAERAAGVR